jgi:hypothetical protein
MQCQWGRGFTTSGLSRSTAISRQLAGHSIFRGDKLSRWDWFSVLTIEAFQTRRRWRSTLLRARVSQVPDEGFQIISGTRQEQFLHNIIGGVLLISKQRNRCEQRLDFLPDSSDILLFLAQNDVRIFHE